MASVVSNQTSTDISAVVSNQTTNMNILSNISNMKICNFNNSSKKNRIISAIQRAKNLCKIDIDGNEDFNLENITCTSRIRFYGYNDNYSGIPASTVFHWNDNENQDISTANFCWSVAAAVAANKQCEVEDDYMTKYKSILFE